MVYTTFGSTCCIHSSLDINLVSLDVFKRDKVSIARKEVSRTSIFPTKLIDNIFVRVNICIITYNNPVQKVFDLCACGQNMNKGATAGLFSIMI